ncbi:uncharacterized protein LOC134260975 [Saccostrea cucullata]|uniref:uncharacterized protein LOC134260975 n=1 Tax=Saccostrea cuccullata TaxID=36930 RepID=UPI002ED3F72C
MMWQLTVVQGFSLWQIARGYTRYLNFDGKCDYIGTIGIDDDETYYLTWNGSEFTQSCSYTFSPGANNKICVDAQQFFISDCSAKLWYYGGLLGSELKRTYSCLDTIPEKFCGEEFHYVKIKLTKSSKTNALGNFTLKVTTTGPLPVGIIIGSIFGGIIFLAIFFSVIRWICRRRQIGRVPNGNGDQSPIITSTVTLHPPPQHYGTTYPGREQNNTTPHPYPSAVQNNHYPIDYNIQTSYPTK